jgi:hypothetical protein
MEQHEMFAHDHNKMFLCKLKNSLYGPRLRKWYNKFDSFMVSLNFSRREYDHFVYFKSFKMTYSLFWCYMLMIFLWQAKV